MATPTRIQVDDVDNAKVVRFNDRQLFDERTVREVAEQISIALPTDGTPIRLVLDFSDVSLISSTLLSKLILIHAGLTPRAASSASASSRPVLSQVFRTSNLDRLFTIDRDQRSSLKALEE